MRRIIITALSALALGAVALPATASAATCSYNGATAAPIYLGKQARFYNLRTSSNMNCASARYVMRQLRRQYHRHGYIRNWFWDGYVTWHGYRTYGRGWRFYENTSHTSFRFSAVQSYWDY
jgi:hypothetical protein